MVSWLSFDSDGDKIEMRTTITKKIGMIAKRFVDFAGLVLICASSVSTQVMAGITLFESAGATPANISPTRDDFRTTVGGGTTAGANGDFGGVRREINWDGVPDGFADPNLLPANFFNSNSPRGVVFSTPGSGFLVSAIAGLPTSTLFGFPGDLQTFSPQRLFASVNSNILDINFFVPGTNTPATTNAFAAVFVDVEDNNVDIFTRMEFFNESDSLIFGANALPAGNQGLTFLGGVANAGERISRVRITTPNNFLVSNGVRANETVDFVVMDDFLYATPTAIPEPGSSVAVGFGLLVCWLRRRRNQST